MTCNQSKSLLIKAVKFFFTSGIGFLLDFSAYFVMTQFLDFSVMRANFISSLIGASFVFVVSSHKIFETIQVKVPIWVKYGVYLLYQLILIVLVSSLGEWLDIQIHMHISWELLLEYSKLLCKVLITPFTMTCNFLVMRFLSEKL